MITDNKLFTLQELKVEHPEIYQTIYNEWRKAETENDLFDIVNSLLSICNAYDVKVTDFHIKPFSDDNFITLDFSKTFERITYYSRIHQREHCYTDALTSAIDTYRATDTSPTYFSWADKYFWGYFSKDVTVDTMNFHTVFKNAINHAINEFVNELEESINDTSYIESIIEEHINSFDINNITTREELF